MGEVGEMLSNFEGNYTFMIRKHTNKPILAKDR